MGGRGPRRKSLPGPVLPLFTRRRARRQDHNGRARGVDGGVEASGSRARKTLDGLQIFRGVSKPAGPPC